MSNPESHSLESDVSAFSATPRTGGIRASLERLGELRAQDDVARLTLAVDRQILRARLVRFGILAALTAGLIASLVGQGDWVGFIAIIAAGLWIAMGTRSARLLQSARQAAMLLAADRLEDAQRLAAACATSLSLNRQVTARSLWTLAGVYSTRNDPRRVAHITSYLLGRPRLSSGAQHASIRLLLAEALANMGEPGSATAAMLPLYQRRLDLAESLRLLLLQLRIEGRTGQFRSMVDNLRQKVETAELLPMPQLLHAHGLLWLAAQRCGLVQWEQFLRRRVQLLGGAERLRPIDHELSRELSQVEGAGS